MGSDATVRARAPGKIILSGEHAAVYGRPALATAVDRYVTVTVAPAAAPRIRLEIESAESSREIALSEQPSFTEQALLRLKEFDQDERSIQTVMPDPLDLLLFNACDVNQGQGLDITLSSEIPIGGGMGSSAAAASAVLAAVHAFVGNPLSQEALTEKTQLSERLQHGTPSGVDAAACVGGGTLLYQKGHSELNRISATLPDIQLVFTGKPESTTGECLTAVRKAIGEAPIWDDIEQCTRHLVRALEEKNFSAWLEGIKENHRLLCAIGVVPESIQSFVNEVERTGGAAKIAGAGTVKGDKAGILTVYAEHVPKTMFKDAGYSWFDVQGGVDGVELL